jgi:hypothetical protein
VIQAETVTLAWRRFTSFIEARNATGANACLYVQADRNGRPVRVGLARHGLHKRYWGGTGWALEAAMHDSGNLWFVALVDRDSCEAAESTLIWQWQKWLPYNQMGKLT